MGVFFSIGIIAAFLSGVGMGYFIKRTIEGDVTGVDDPHLIQRKPGPCPYCGGH